MQTMLKRSGRRVRNSSESRFRDSPITFNLIISCGGTVNEDTGFMEFRTADARVAQCKVLQLRAAALYESIAIEPLLLPGIAAHVVAVLLPKAGFI